MMDVDGLQVIGPRVNYNEVRAIHQKRTLAFINHFIANTVSFLNKFSRTCEFRLEKFETQIQKLEASLSILEAKLISISGLENDTSKQPLETNREEQLESSIPQSEVKEEPYDRHREETVIKDPRIAGFLRMVQVGVPVQAVHLKMQVEGLDPSLLKNDGSTTTKAVPRHESSDSESTANSLSD